MAQSIYRSWFVNFEPWNGIHPITWQQGTLSDIAQVTMGQSPAGSSYNQIGDGTVFYQGRSEFGERFPTRRLFTTAPKRMASEGDLMMSVRAPVGDLNIATESCCLGRGLAGLRSKSNSQSFLYYTMKSLEKELDVFNGEGTVFGSINKKDTEHLPVLIPNVLDINRFEHIVKPMDDVIKANTLEIWKLRNIRDDLLPRIMSGDTSL